jgi:hypothetical protein
VSLALVLCLARPSSSRSVCRTVDVGSSWAVEVWISGNYGGRKYPGSHILYVSF